jgi:hypothetical protein
MNGRTRHGAPTELEEGPGLSQLETWRSYGAFQNEVHGSSAVLWEVGVLHEPLSPILSPSDGEREKIVPPRVQGGNARVVRERQFFASLMCLSK